MLLSGQTIAIRVAEQRIIRNFDDSFLEACSYDMRIGTVFEGGQTRREEGHSVIVPPGRMVSFFTLEELALPADLTALAFARNQEASKGLLVLNPGHVDPGFDGPLIVKVLNLRKAEITVSIGDPIFTVVFIQLDQPSDRPYSKTATRRTRETQFNDMESGYRLGNIRDLWPLDQIRAVVEAEVSDSVERLLAQREERKKEKSHKKFAMMISLVGLLGVATVILVNRIAISAAVAGFWGWLGALLGLDFPKL